LNDLYQKAKYKILFPSDPFSAVWDASNEGNKIMENRAADNIGFPLIA
jgi:hypothetical protein